jgi:hypothetical protein
MIIIGILGGCWDPITDYDRPIREIGDSDKIARWAIEQQDFGQKIGALNVLFKRASETTPRNTFEGERAIHAYLQILYEIEDNPPDKSVPYTAGFSNPSPETIRKIVLLAYNSAAFKASESVGGTGVFFRIKPDAQHVQWLPEWQGELDLLEKTWSQRLYQLDTKTAGN